MSKKPHKVEETQAPYAPARVTKAAAPAGKPAIAREDKEFRRITEKLFAERKELLSKLAE